jgi:hypothetical protein
MCLSHFAAFFIGARTKISIAKSCSAFRIFLVNINVFPQVCLERLLVLVKQAIKEIGVYVIIKKRGVANDSSTEVPKRMRLTALGVNTWSTC